MYQAHPCKPLRRRKERQPSYQGTFQKIARRESFRRASLKFSADEIKSPNHPIFVASHMGDPNRQHFAWTVTREEVLPGAA
jgi:hypothetical protein